MSLQMREPGRRCIGEPSEIVYKYADTSLNVNVRHQQLHIQTSQLRSISKVHPTYIMRFSIIILCATAIGTSTLVNAAPVDQI